MPVKKGDKVKVEYSGTLDDGTIFDSSQNQGKPLEFEAGSGKVIKGFDEAVIGMEQGQEKEIKLTPEEAYGEPNPKLVKQIPLSEIPQGKELKAGMMLAVGLPNGAQIPAKVMEVTSDSATIDLNHPLAGKTLNFKIKVIA